MIEGQEEIIQRHCPRCGGLMHKPSGSTLYWHVDNNHSRCDITNIVETSLENTPVTSVEPVPDAPKPRSRRGK
ncbi:MAG TPA: hypothetical protein VGD98_24925 [Ktedonobacteraceae bacterium]